MKLVFLTLFLGLVALVLAATATIAFTPSIETHARQTSLRPQITE